MNRRGDIPAPYATPKLPIVEARLGGVLRHSREWVKDMRMRIPTHLLQNVAFIGILDTSDPSRLGLKLRGTCFFVLYPRHLDVLQNSGFLYLVTAAHVAESLFGQPWGLRINDKNGRGRVYRGGDHVQWHFHPSRPDNVDVAVAFIPHQASWDLAPIPTSVFATDDVVASEGIGEGDQVFTVGVFSKHIGVAANQPIVRTGTIAMMPRERIATGRGEMDAVLVESRSIGGLSGSPVYVEVTPKHGEAGVRGRLFFLGIAHGHWDLPPGSLSDALSDEDGGRPGRGGVNMGIAIVAPAQSVIETLECRELTSQRMMIERKLSHGEDDLPVMDLGGDAP